MSRASDGTTSAGEDDAVLTALDKRALSVLKPHRHDLCGRSASQRAIYFVAETWRNWLEGSGLDRDLNKVLKSLDNQAIDRGDLRRLAGDSATTAGRRRLFIASLIWGRGKSNGRMKRHIIRALEHRDRDQVLERTAEAAIEGRPSDAYRAWTLPGLRLPFFSKWLWASTLDSEVGPRCLVLDGRVHNSLTECLDWSDREAAGVRWLAERYEAYVRAMHRWARDLSSRSAQVSAEDIECALFEANGKPARLQKD